MYCPKCGKEIPDKVKFCPECGASLSQESESSIDETLISVQEEESTENSQTSDSENFAETERMSNITEDWSAPSIPANSVSSSGRDKTLEILAKCKDIAKVKDGYIMAENELQKKIDEAKKKAEEIRNELSRIAVGIEAAILVIAIILVLYNLFSNGFFSAVFSAIIWLFVLWASCKIIEPLDRSIHDEDNKKNAKAYIDEHVKPLEQQLAAAQMKTNDYENSDAAAWAIDVVGEKMFAIEPIETLYDLVKSRRADNLKEALNLYESIKYQQRMENMQHNIQAAAETSAEEATKQTELTASIEKSSRASARNTYASAVHTRNIDRKLGRK